MIVEVAKVLAKHQVTLPKEVRDYLGVSIDDRIVFVETPDGLLIRRVDESVVSALISGSSQTKEEK